MEKTNERKVYCAPQCTWLELESEGLMQRTSVIGSGHASAGDSGGLNAKAHSFFEDEDENEDVEWKE